MLAVKQCRNEMHQAMAVCLQYMAKAVWKHVFISPVAGAVFLASQCWLRNAAQESKPVAIKV